MILTRLIFIVQLFFFGCPKIIVHFQIASISKLLHNKERFLLNNCIFLNWLTILFEERNRMWLKIEAFDFFENIFMETDVEKRWFQDFRW